MHSVPEELLICAELNFLGIANEAIKKNIVLELSISIICCIITINLILYILIYIMMML